MATVSDSYLSEAHLKTKRKRPIVHNFSERVLRIAMPVDLTLPQNYGMMVGHRLSP
jgi:hypothetical protein